MQEIAFDIMPVSRTPVFAHGSTLRQVRIQRCIVAVAGQETVSNARNQRLFDEQNGIRIILVHPFAVFLRIPGPSRFQDQPAAAFRQIRSGSRAVPFQGRTVCDAEGRFSSGTGHGVIGGRAFERFGISPGKDQPVASLGAHKIDDGGITMKETYSRWEQAMASIYQTRGRDEGIAIGIDEGITKGIVIGRDEGIAIGRDEGIAIGRDEGISEGIAIGRDEGRDEVRRIFALNLLRDGISPDLVARYTDMSLEEVQALIEEEKQ